MTDSIRQAWVIFWHEPRGVLPLCAFGPMADADARSLGESIVEGFTSVRELSYEISHEEPREEGVKVLMHPGQVNLVAQYLWCNYL